MLMSNQDIIDILLNGEVVYDPQASGSPSAPREPPRDPPPPGNGGNPPDEPDDDDGGSVETLNREFSLILMGSKAVIMKETPEAPIEDRTRVISIDAFKAYFANRGSTVWRRVRQADGSWRSEQRYQKWAPAWLAAPNRRTYDGIEFFPDRENAAGTEKYFNIWRGFGCAPDPAPAEERRLKYKIFRDHLLTNICSGDQRLFDWVFGWIAHIVQRPRERIGTAIVLRGKRGAGKTKVGEVVGSLFPSHYFLVDDPRYLTGNFNAHMASCLLLQVDEGFWAGDKTAEGRLKGLTTAPMQMIEAKGIDPIRLKNYVRLLFSSNEDWVIPAGMDERRFCVLDVAAHSVQNFEYFAEMDAEMDHGGREALLADLLSLDLDAPGAPNLRVIPKTEALLEQKLRSLDPISNWWFERLSDGTTTRRGGSWQSLVSKDTLFDDFIHAAEKIGVRRKAEQTAFGMKLKKLVPGLTKTQRTVPVEIGDGSTEMRLRWCFRLPSLNECRAAFEAAAGQSITWETADDEARPQADNEDGDEEQF